MQDILRAHRISLPKKTLTRLFLLSISAVYFLGILLTPVYAQEAYSSQPTPQKLSEGIRKPEHLTFLLPEALVSTVSSFLRYSTSFIFGAGSVEAESDIPTKKTTPFIDRISLTLYCAFSKSDSDPRCDYDSATQELFSVPSATSQTANQTVTQAAGTAISGVETATSTAVSTTPPVSTVTPAPVYITRYITQIVEGLPGRDGKDGKDGRDGKDGLASVNGIQMVPGYGSYINPMVNSSNIVGISTIGYLKDATIDTSILNGGSALNLSLSAPTLTNAVFNASSLFNGPATFLGNVGINSLSATSSTFGSALITDLTVSSSTITNLTGTNFWSNLATIVTGIFTNLTATNATTTNATSTNLFTTNATIVNASVTNATSTNLTATNATTTNATSTNFFSSLLSATTGLFTTLSSTGTSTFATSDGNVGIGTTNPTNKLSVVSDVIGSTTPKSAIASFDNLQLTSLEGGTFLGRSRISESSLALANYGVNWIARETSRNWTAIAMSSDGRIQTATAYNGQLYTSTDYGVTWTPRDSNRNWYGIAMSSDGRIQTATPFGGQIYTSTDYGITWTARDSNRNWIGVAMSSDGRIQTATALGDQLYTSTDYGVTWTARDSVRDWDGVAMSSDGRIQTAITYGAQIYTSTDYGITWTARDSSRNWYSVAMSSDGRIQTAAAIGGDQLYTSTDYGVTWTARDSNRDWIAVAMSSDGRIQTAVVTNGQLYTSTDYGVSWTARESSRGWRNISMSSDGRIQTAAVNGGQLYTSTADVQTQGNLKVAGNIDNTSSSVNLALIGSVGVGFNPSAVKVVGRYAYVVNNGSNIFMVIDVSNPAFPAVISSAAIGQGPVALDVSGRYAYVLNYGSRTMQVVDISNPSSVSVVGSVAVGTQSNSAGDVQSNSIAVVGNYAYIVNTGSNSFQVIDIASPTAPRVVSTYTSGLSAPTSVALAGSYAYVTNRLAGLQLINISNPLSPTAAGSVTAGSYPETVAVSGRYAYVTNSIDNTLSVIDVSNPASPPIIATLAIGSTPKSVSINGRYAYVSIMGSSGQGKIQVIDIASSTAPSVVGTSLTISGPTSIYISGRYGYVTSFDSDTLKILDVGGLETSGATIASLEAGSAQIRNDLVVQGNTFMSALNAVSAYVENLSAKVLSAASLVLGSASSMVSNAILSINTNTTGTELTTKNSASSFTVSGYATTTGVAINSAAQGGGITLLLASTTSIGNGTMTAGPSLSSGTAQYGSHSIQRPDGKFLIINGGATSTTNLYDPVANTFVAGPSLANGNADDGSHSIQRPDGKFLVINGNQTAVTNIYDPVANTMTAGPSLASGLAWVGSHSIQRPDGKFLIINGSNSAVTNLYDPVANTMTAGPSFATETAGYGSHSIQRPDGKFLIINGGLATTTNLYDPVANTMTAGPSLASGTADDGSHSIQRPDGKFLIINGGGTATTNLYDPVANTFAVGPSLSSGTASNGSHSIQRPDGKFLIINGGLATTTNLYDPVANTFTLGPSLSSGTADDGSHSIQRPDGKFLIINGNNTSVTNIYDPSYVTSGTWESEDMNLADLNPSSVLNYSTNGEGSILVAVKTATTQGGLSSATYATTTSGAKINPVPGAQWAKVRVTFRRSVPTNRQPMVNANETNTWLGGSDIKYQRSFANPTLYSFSILNQKGYHITNTDFGTNAASTTLTSNATSGPIISNLLPGDNGLTLPYTLDIPDNASAGDDKGAISSGPSLSSGTISASAHSLQRPDGKFLIINGGATATTTLYDPVTNTFTAGPSLATGTASTGSHSIQRPDGKFLIINGGITATTNIYDPVANTFVAGPSLATGTASTGSHSLQRPDGKFLVINGDAATTNLYDPVANTFTAGPSLSSGTISASAHSLQRPDGKFLIINGGATATTTLYDPVTNTFTAGPSLATGTASTGSHSIQRPDGKFLIINGNNGSVTNIYDPVANTFIAGPSLATGTAYIGSHSLQRPDGKFLIINGNGAATNLYDPVANTFVAGPTLATGTADGGSHSLQRPDGKFLIINGNGVATNLYDPGWITRGYYESEFVNDATLDTNSVLTWKGNADAYKAGVVSVRVRTATSSAALQTALWRTLPVSGSKINPASAETWIQVRFEMNRVIPGSVGVLRNSVPTDGGIIVYNRLPLNPSAGYANQAGVFIKPTVYSYAIQKQEGQDLATFQVNGNNVFRFSATGDAYTAPGGSWNAGGADVAEYFPTEDMLLEPGDVVSVSQDEKGLVSMTTTDYDETLLGIVTTAPGLRLGSDDIGANQHKQPIALAGRVPVKISLENGPVKKGDYLTSSRNRPGYAMKSLDAGRVVGIALEDYTLDDDAEHGGAGKVLVFVNPQFSMGPSFMEKVTGNFSRIAIMIRKGVSEFGITIAEDGNVGFGVINPLSKIHSASNVRLGVASTTSGTLLFHNEANGFVTGIRSATSTLASDFTFTLPDTIGDPRQALMGDGAGSLYWGRVAYIGKNGTTTPGYAVRWLPDGEVASGVLMDDGEVAGVHATSSAAFTVAQATETQPAFSVLSAIKHTFFSVDGSGMVSVGTSTASSRFAIFDETTSNDADLFQVVSNVGQVNDSKFRVTAGGDLFVKSSISVGLGASIAESYPALEAVDAGTVVAFGASTSTWETSIGTTTESFDIMGIVKATSSIEAIGIVTANPGVALATKTRQGVSVAFLGRVPVKVTTENGIVRAGDYLTVSTSTPGYAMKLTGEGRAIGRAVSDYREGRDKVMVLIDKGDHMLDLSGNFATTTKMLTTGNVDLNANAVAIINIKSLTSANGSWSIDENGRIVAQVLCLGNVCINKDQLTNMLNSTGQGSASGNQSSGDSGETGTAVPEGEATGIATSTDSSTSEPSQVSAASEEGEADDPEPETPPVTVASEPETIQ